jgi:pimeloyl-ACP methyl ester carboxylesterase
MLEQTRLLAPGHRDDSVEYQVTTESYMMAQMQRKCLAITGGAEVVAFVSHHRTDGMGRVMLLHGNPGSSQDWRRVFPVLANAVDVVALDLPGFGESKLLPGQPNDLKALASTVLSAANLLGWQEPFVIAGHMLPEYQPELVAHRILQVLREPERAPLGS